MRLFLIPAIVITVVLSVIPNGDKCARGSGHWTYNGEDPVYVYQTKESAVYEGECDGVAYFITTEGDIEGEVWGAYIYDSDLQDGDVVTLTFENSVSKSEYDRAVECGIPSGTRIDSGRIIGVD